MKALCRKAVERVVAKEVTTRDRRWCPSCQNALRVWEGEWTCGTCGGRIVSFLTVKRLFGDVLMSYIIEQIQPYMDPIYGRACPACKRNMVVTPLPTRSSLGGHIGWRGERVDVCAACDTLWVDAGEMVYQPS